MKRNVVHIIGGRPQFIKCLITIKAINKYKIQNYIINTGQHFDDDMSNNFLKLYPKKYEFINLKLSQTNQTQRLSKMISLLDIKLSKLNFSLIIIYGDTDSTLAAVIASMKKNFKLMHIESGLRSDNLLMPEEKNRIIADNICDYLITPTRTAYKNLLKENIKKSKIFNYGDVMLDNINYFKKVISKKKISNLLNLYSLKENNYIYFSVHREANSNYVFINKIISQLTKIGKKVIWPMHPKFNKLIKKINIPSNLFIIKPLNFDENFVIISNSLYVITDSGGIQKESYFLNKKVLILRKETEWLELISNNNSKLINNKIPIEKNINKFLKLKVNKSNYGNGNASLKIARLINKIVY